MPSDGTIDGLVGKLDVLRIECPTSGRQGRYHVARLLEQLDAAAHMMKVGVPAGGITPASAGVPREPSPPQ